MPRKRPTHLVLEFLEGISSRVFSEFSQGITGLVGRKQGVYALYKGNRLYYVGLATNLRRRVKQHLKDKHKGKWNKFSVYLVRKSEHIKELESLILRIADPAGNAVGGRLPHAKNLQPEIRRRMRETTEERINVLLGRGSKKAPPSRRAAHVRRPAAQAGKLNWKVQPPLAPFVSRSFKIHGTNKGKAYEARVFKSGKVKFEDKIYQSPSGAAKAALGRASNGWRFWRYRNSKGEWVRLNELKRKK